MNITERTVLGAIVHTVFKAFRNNRVQSTHSENALNIIRAAHRQCIAIDAIEKISEGDLIELEALAAAAENSVKRIRNIFDTMADSKSMTEGDLVELETLTTATRNRVRYIRRCFDAQEEL